MVRYRRNFVPGGTYFFTVTLADRTSSALLDHVSALRMAFRIARQERPFAIDAIVILPEHLHAIWTLPSGNSDFSGRWRRIKAYFTHRLVAAGVPVKRHRNGEYALWQRRFWEHTIRNETDFERHVDYVHFNPVKTFFVFFMPVAAFFMVVVARRSRESVARMERSEMRERHCDSDRRLPDFAPLIRATLAAPRFRCAPPGLLARKFARFQKEGQRQLTDARCIGS